MIADRVFVEGGHSGPAGWKKSKLTTLERLEIGYERMEGKGPLELAKKYGVSRNVIMGIAKIGIVRSRQLLGWWRYAILLAFVMAAIVTPSIDPVTQTVVAAPIMVLYGLGILLARMVEGTSIIGSRR